MASRRLREEWKQTCHIMATVHQIAGNDVTWKDFYPYTDDEE